MKKFNYETSGRPLIFEIHIKPLDNTRVFIKVEDAVLENTVFTDRFKDMKKGKTEKFFIRMPLSPKLAKFQIWDSKKGSFVIIKTKVEPLIAKMDLYDFGNRDAAKFIIFAEEFAQKSGYHSPGTYYNDTGEFQITFMPMIKDMMGENINSPARINSKTGIIQISKEKFNNFTVPGRFAILLHEFAHVFANKNMRDEIEADFHAATIYLALGYPQVDLLNVFASVFYYSDTQMNRERFKKLYNYARNFKDNIYQIKYKI